MKYVVAIGLSIASLALAYTQETSSSKQRVSSSIGLKVGQNERPSHLAINLVMSNPSRR